MRPSVARTIPTNAALMRPAVCGMPLIVPLPERLNIRLRPDRVIRPACRQQSRYAGESIEVIPFPSRRGGKEAKRSGFCGTWLDSSAVDGRQSIAVRDSIFVVAILWTLVLHLQTVWVLRQASLWVGTQSPSPATSSTMYRCVG